MCCTPKWSSKQNYALLIFKEAKTQIYLSKISKNSVMFRQAVFPLSLLTNWGRKDRKNQQNEATALYQPIHLSCAYIHKQQTSLSALVSVPNYGKWQESVRCDWPASATDVTFFQDICRLEWLQAIRPEIGRIGPYCYATNRKWGYFSFGNNKDFR